MEDYQQRVVEEKRELDAKRARLDAFIATPEFKRIGRQARTLMEDQSGAMSLYSHILSRRIGLFDTDEQYDPA